MISDASLVEADSVVAIINCSTSIFLSLLTILVYPTKTARPVGNSLFLLFG
jgi:hypothetical protein